MTDPIQARAAEPLWAALRRRPVPAEAAGEPSGPADTVTLSAEARLALSPIEESQDAAASEDATQSLPEEGAPASGAGEDEEAEEGELTPEEQDLVSRLKARDREVRAHEAAHISAAGGMAGGATYTYQLGPDGNRYAIGGEVQIATPSTSDPRQALANAQRLRAAALAPASPSGQDRAVAAEAAAMESRARAQLAREDAEADEGAEEGVAGAGAGEEAGEAPAWTVWPSALGPPHARGVSAASATERFRQQR